MADVLQAIGLSKELDELVEKLTTSGQAELDQPKLKRVKNICKTSDEYVKKCFHAVMIQLEKEHSEIRLSSVQLVDELFNRSHCFRDLLLADFQYFMELAIGTNVEFPLPLPKRTAQTLKTKTIEIVHKWHEKFGDAYKKLALGYNYLKNCRKVNFQDAHARSFAQQQRAEELRVRTEAQQGEKLKKASDEMTEMTNEIKMCLTQANNCLLLLLPDPGNFQINGILSPDIFHLDDPWKPHQALPVQRHVNKSTKSKVENLKNPDLCVKIEPNDDDGNMDASNIVESSQLSPMVERDHELHNSGSCEDVKPNVEASQMAITTESSASASAPMEIPQNKHVSHLQTVNDENSNDSGDFHEISSEESNEEMSEDESDEDDSMRGHGISSQAYTCSINIDMVRDAPEIVETADNEDILMTLNDCVRLTETKLLPAIQRWLEVFTKRGGEQSHIKRALDLKAALLKMKEKSSTLKIVKAKKVKKVNTDLHTVKEEVDSEDDDEDFEEVSTKEGYEPDIPSHLREEYGLVDTVLKPSTNPDWHMPSMSQEDEQDPTSAMSTLKRIKQQHATQESQGTSVDAAPGSSARSSDKKTNICDIPVLPFAMDLYHWGEKMETPLHVKNEVEKYWVPEKTEEIVDMNAIATMNTRVINFIGKFEQVKWTCRAPLPNGKLCPRMDRYKCPFHGKVVARDNMGQPINTEDQIKLEMEEEKRQEEETPEWEDPGLQADILAATGIDLARKGKKKQKGKRKPRDKQKKYPGLTDISRVSSPVRNRLERKILNQNAVRRVADALNAVEQKKRNDKFGNSFNYVHGPRSK